MTGFKPGIWEKMVDVRDFIARNAVSYTHLDEEGRALHQFGGHAPQPVPAAAGAAS